MIQSQDGSFKSVTAFGVTSFTTPEAAQADEVNFRKWAESRAGQKLTDRQLLDGIHSDNRSGREKFAAKERRRELFTPPAAVDTRLPEEQVADDAERRAEEKRREAMALPELHALKAREAAVLARKAADLRAERDRIRQTTDFVKVREELNNLRVEVAFDPNASYALLEEVQLQLDLLDTNCDAIAGREAVKVLKKAARERTENFLSQQQHVDIAKERLAKVYRDLPYDVAFRVDRGVEYARLSDPQTGKVVNMSVAEFEKRTPEQVHAFVNEHGRTRDESLSEQPQ
jgi:hypothetical protein